jgi:hypothetical protein
MSEGIANRPVIVAVMGSTGAGKSTYIKRTWLDPLPRRLMVWDGSPIDEYRSFGATVTLSQLVAAAGAAGKGGDIRLVFKPSDDAKIRAREFDIFCTLAMRLGSLTILVEELKFVTNPSYAPMPWANCLLNGRKMGLRVIGTSQRPAHIDKDFFGNATIIRTGVLGYPEDVKALAGPMRVTFEDIDALVPVDDDSRTANHWIQFERRNRLVTRGRLTF